MTATYMGIKGTRAVQEFLPNTYPGATSSCLNCPLYMTSNGNSTRESGELLLRRRLHAGLTASVDYVYSKSIDDALLGGRGERNSRHRPELAQPERRARALALRPASRRERLRAIHDRHGTGRRDAPRRMARQGL